MAGSEIHACFELIAENEKFRRRLQSLLKENKELKERLNSFEEQQKIQILVQQSVHTRCVETQTESVIRRGGGGGIWVNRFPSTKPVKKTEDEGGGQLLKLTVQHTNLLRQYDREVKSSLKHVEEISSLTMKVLELEQKLSDAQSKLKEPRSEKTTVRTGNRCASSRPNNAAETLLTDISRLQLEVNSLQSEKIKLEKQYKSLKSELQSLDPGFFEEIEDLKFALQQSALLNKEYEKVLRQMCLRFGIPYPHPEHILSTR